MKAMRSGSGPKAGLFLRSANISATRLSSCAQPLKKVSRVLSAAQSLSSRWPAVRTLFLRRPSSEDNVVSTVKLIGAEVRGCEALITSFSSPSTVHRPSASLFSGRANLKRGKAALSPATETAFAARYFAHSGHSVTRS